jgi:Mn2+/Fe2+ NRAMP family transporter
MNIIEYIFVFLVGVMSICFMINMIKIPKNGVEIVEGMFIPRIPGGAV